MPTNIGDNRISREDIACIKQEDAKRLSRYRVKVGDIVYSRRGDVERRALVREQEDGWLCGTGCLRVRVGTAADPLYASYYLGHPQVREWIVRHAIGATMPNLNTGILSSLPFVSPPLELQRTIGRILGALDDKIELNRRMNETLEAMAQALFKSWFIDFDPVIDNALATGTTIPEDIQARAAVRESLGDARKPLPEKEQGHFPSEFDFTDEMGWIPKGWEQGAFGDVAVEQRRGKQTDEISPGTPYIALAHMPRRCISLTEWDIADSVESNKSEFYRGEILFGKLRPYFHKVGIAPVDGVCSTDIVVVTPKRPEWFGFVLCHISSAQFVDYTNTGSAGTKMPRTSWKEMARYKLVKPPIEIAIAFNKIVSANLEKIRSNIHDIKALDAMRDTLLPKLLSGEVRVSEADKMIEATT